MEYSINLNQPGQYGTKSALQYLVISKISPPSGSSPQSTNFASVPKVNLAVHEVPPSQMLHGDKTHSSFAFGRKLCSLLQRGTARQSGFKTLLNLSRSATPFVQMVSLHNAQKPHPLTHPHPADLQPLHPL